MIVWGREEYMSVYLPLSFILSILLPMLIRLTWGSDTDNPERFTMARWVYRVVFVCKCCLCKSEAEL